ncbi:MAG: VWA domain-containing protein [Deltaproteobacteria bacterium]|nr:VWA domain-containing protein [Deltaproteobacteria bacterium]
MKHISILAVAILAMTTWIALQGCEEQEPSAEQGSPGGDADADTDTDIDADADTDTDADTDADADADADADTDTDTDTDTSTDTESCGENNFKVEFKKIEMLIVLDRSYSMTYYDPQLWGPMGSALPQVTAAFEDFIDFGLMLFPDIGCVQKELDTVCVPPSGPYIEIGDPAVVTKIEDVFGSNGTNTCGGTPTGPTLSAALDYLSSLDGDTTRHVLLATDGAPACNEDLDGPTCTCVSEDSCESQPLNCLDDIRTNAAATALADAGFHVYVLGMGGGTKWATQLNAIASAGGTNEYYEVENTNNLLDTFEEITAEVVNCEFDVDWSVLPQEASDEPELVNFYCKENESDPIGPENLVGLDVDCAGNEGWTWTDDTYTGVQFCEEACIKLKKRECTAVTATFGCISIPVQ